VSVHGSRSESVARLTVPEAIAESVHRYAAHPALLDIFFQTMGHFLIDGPEFTGGDIMFPTSVRRIVLHQRLKGPDATAHARLVNRSSSGVEADLCVLNGGGDAVVEVEGFTISRIGRESLNDEM